MNDSKQELATASLDAVSVGIMWDRLVSISDEIVSTLVRTSFSTIVTESYDLTVAVLDADGELMAQGTYSVPVFMGTAPATLQFMLDRFPAATLRPGDVNDPWFGTGHIFDINVMRPIFHADEIVAYVISITHLPDVGGLGFGAAAEEIYHEGLRLPICKLFDAGELNEFIIELVRTNVRAPEEVVGDLMANVTATAAGERMLIEFLDEYELGSFTALSSEIRTRSTWCRGCTETRCRLKALTSQSRSQWRSRFAPTAPCMRISKALAPACAAASMYRFVMHARWCCTRSSV